MEDSVTITSGLAFMSGLGSLQFPARRKAHNPRRLRFSFPAGIFFRQASLNGRFWVLGLVWAAVHFASCARNPLRRISPRTVEQ